MIEYRVYVQNNVNGTLVTSELLNYRREGIALENSVLTWQIVDHMFVGTYVFTIHPWHRNYDKIDLFKTTIFITEDGKEVFHGRAVDVDEDKYGRRKYTCESDIKFLVDVPDIFSKVMDAKPVYYMGLPGDESDWPDYLWFNNEPSQVLTNTVYGNYEPSDLFAYSWPDYKFRRDEIGKRFTIEVMNQAINPSTQQQYGVQSHELSMQTFLIERSDNPNFPIRILYFGDLSLAYNSRDGGLLAERLHARLMAEDMVDGVDKLIYPTVNVPGDHTDCDFCIVHVTDYLLPKDITAGTLPYRGRNVTHVWIAEELPPTHKIAFLAKRDTQTTVADMANAVFCEYTPPTPGEDPDYGYCKYAGDYREIYRGHIVTADSQQNPYTVEYTSVGSVYGTVQKWTQATGGYARIRRGDGTDGADGVYYIDLLADTGIEDDGFRVKLGENVSDYKKSTDINSLVTEIYPIGRHPQNENYRLDLTDIDTSSFVLQNNYSVNDSTGIVKNDMLFDAYGTIIQYKEYDISFATGIGSDATVKKTRQQYLYNQAVQDLKSKNQLDPDGITFDISAVDPRLIGKEGAVLRLGNKYKVSIPLWGDDRYIPLTKIVTDMAKPSNSRLTFGETRKLLSDYAANGGI